ncbi:hypothetical protein OTU49_002131 [Cherax quadricarinatus]|uniref:Uncharacterized protein n=1 Tax=Cherax quadricarinatus TaxID=27406 RepID=A0AAW0XQA0_CHEQU
MDASLLPAVVSHEKDRLFNQEIQIIPQEINDLEIYSYNYWCKYRYVTGACPTPNLEPPIPSTSTPPSASTAPLVREDVEGISHESQQDCQEVTNWFFNNLCLSEEFLVKK